MAEVTIKAQQTFGGIRAGEVVTVERTPYIDRLVENKRVVLVDADGLTPEQGAGGTGSFAPDNDPADGEFDQSTAPTTPPESSADDAGEAADDDTDDDADDGTD